MRLRGRHHIQAFSLLEVLLASLLFAAIFSGIAVTWKFHERSLQKYRNRNAARTILSQELERITAYSYVYLEHAARTETVELVRTVDHVPTRKAFKTVSTVTENAEGSLKTIEASVSFEEFGETRTLTVITRAFQSQ